MEQYGKILLIAMPVFLVLVLAEKMYGYLKDYDTVRYMDMVSSLSSGITNIVKDVLGLSVTILSYSWLVKHIAVFELKSNLLVFTTAFIALDFQGYWVHRLSHEINIFWNKHAIHHSSEEFNLACALRQSVSSFVNLFAFFLVPAALLGVPAEVIATVAPLHLFAQFWYHTQHIGRMGFLEKIIVTPSHHRVHHAINPEYIDKNHGQIFIIWDKLFGTFQEERDDIRPVYGITRPAKTWNPIRINFQHLVLMLTDALRTKNLNDKLKIWFMPTGWRPKDVDEQFPVPGIEDIFQFDKYNPATTFVLQLWSGVQLISVFVFCLFFFGNLKEIGSPGIFYYGLYVFLAVYAYTELMDGKAMAIWWEALKTLSGFSLLYVFGSVELIQEKLWAGEYVVTGWLVASFLITLYMVRYELKQSTLQPTA
ncbi:MAG TPA: sterol desaturase family protein [Saprospiraceae bacterium]|nr:sterol desaturase family protein [Saprospiraceae bacterium]MCC6687417.1 sterol desaturase family protein [Saprospiraceae bacterium]HMW74962.1 sterol desaturase family protein [Saprospiraceae bacterium]HMX83433.1 sterol desaturase family protein [Saprospiraceae bacterium]HMX86632.1 sterol desaturase family protein [Saprospiraceae bacterium]